MDEQNQLLSPELIDKLWNYAEQVAWAILVLVIGLIVIRVLTGAVKKAIDKRGLDETLKPFLGGIVNIVLKIALVLTILGMFGVQATSFIAILGAVGLAVGMALSGTLQNFAGGVMLLIFKPFKKGDWIDAQGYSGTVHEIQIFNTILKTPDNKTVIIPNGGLSTNAMVNYSTEPTRRLDLTFGIGYGDDIDKARAVLQGIIDAEERIKQDPAPAILISALADSSVNFSVRSWVDAGDYWPLYFELQEKVKKAFDKEGISIPFPQTDVHLFQEK